MVGDAGRDLGGAAREDVDGREAELGPGVDGDMALGQDDDAARPVRKEAREPRVDDVRSAIARRLLERAAEPFEVVEARGRHTVKIEEDVGPVRVLAPLVSWDLSECGRRGIGIAGFSIGERCVEESRWAFGREAVTARRQGGLLDLLSPCRLAVAAPRPRCRGPQPRKTRERDAERPKE